MNYSSSKKPTVSVCIVTYNHAAYIERALLSVLNQNVDFEYEVIIGDDKSKDNTLSIIKKIASSSARPVKVVEYPENVGASENYRRLHNIAKGQYIAHLDGDDFWHDDKLKKQVEFLESNKNCSAVYTNADVYSNSGECIGIFSKGVKRIFNLDYLLKDRNFLTASSLMYRSIHKKFILPNEAEFVDFQVHIRLALVGDLGFIDEGLTMYTLSSNGSALANNSKLIRYLVGKSLMDEELTKSNTNAAKKARAIFFLEEVILSFIELKLFKAIEKYNFLTINGTHRFGWVNLLYSIPLFINKAAKILLNRLTRVNSKQIILFKK